MVSFRLSSPISTTPPVKNALLFLVTVFSLSFAGFGQIASVDHLFSEGNLTKSEASRSMLLAGKNKSGFQFLFGLKAGASTANIAADEVDFTNAGRQFKIAVEENEFSYHLGVFSQFRVNNWTIQPEVLFRSSRSDYAFSEFVTSEFVTSIRTEKYAYVDVPLMFAYRVGALRLQAGPVAKFYIDSSTELIGIAEYSESFDQVEFGYQAGIGLDIWRFVVDLKYDRDLDNIGDHMSFAGQTVDFNAKAGRFLFSVGYSLLKP